MSQPPMNQPPPGQYPSGQYPPGQPGQYPAGQYGYPPPKKKHTVRNVLLILGLLLVLFIGGCVALAGAFFNEVDKAIDEETANDKPVAVKEGEAFEHDDFKIDGGWTVGDDGIGSPTIEGMSVTNDDDLARSALLTFRFYKGSTNLAEVECSSGEMQEGESSKMDCFSADDIPKGYDTIKVSDAW